MKASEFKFTSTAIFNNPQDAQALRDLGDEIDRKLNASNGRIDVTVDSRFRILVWNTIAWKLRDDGWIVNYVSRNETREPYLSIMHPHSQTIVPVE